MALESGAERVVDPGGWALRALAQYESYFEFQIDTDTEADTDAASESSGWEADIESEALCELDRNDEFADCHSERDSELEATSELLVSRVVAAKELLAKELRYCELYTEATCDSVALASSEDAADDACCEADAEEAFSEEATERLTDADADIDCALAAPGAIAEIRAMPIVAAPNPRSFARLDQPAIVFLQTCPTAQRYVAHKALAIAACFSRRMVGVRLCKDCPGRGPVR